MVELEIEKYSGNEEPFVPGSGTSVEFELEEEIPGGSPEETGEKYIEFELEPKEETVFNAWLYKFKAVDAVSGEQINAKIIIDGYYSGSWTPANFYLEPSSTYNFRLTKYGYDDAEVTINTPALP